VGYADALRILRLDVGAIDSEGGAMTDTEPTLPALATFTTGETI